MRFFRGGFHQNQGEMYRMGFVVVVEVCVPTSILCVFLFFWYLVFAGFTFIYHIGFES